eukprot:TRINITY_DN6533_c0_g1_i5.p1 TRINITY_DN6533_c0_g1~~TRINITY_DN6533_c0_g1_i5.p1  ORF type:complete len:373 (+),score=60.31 TRINITY_DN6533_c0_g1_i5:3-1121(+)
MCIRDRYQRRVHGDSRLLITMKSGSVITLCLLFASVMASLRGNQNGVPTQDFLTGLSKGTGIDVRGDIISLIEDFEFSKDDLSVALDTIIKPSRRVLGIQLLFNTFWRFSNSPLNKKASQDSNFINLINTTLYTLLDPIQVQYKADLYLNNTGVNIYQILAVADNYKNIKDYYNTGLNLGNVIIILNNTSVSKDPAQFITGKLKYYPTQDFIWGQLVALNLDWNDKLLFTISNTSFSQADLNTALDIVINPAYRIEGLELLYGAYYRFSQKVDPNAYKMGGFSDLMNITLNLLSDPVQFQARVDLCKKNTGIDIYQILRVADSYRIYYDYYNAGLNFGNAIQLLNNVSMPQEDSVILEAVGSNDGKGIYTQE